ncbi:TonB-dependent siderophore receptor [Massilia yuzhufengensis]|uniref:Iron complex outermembrane recepter protein n=1 Tax=Massilia yuzhufengensis TaxID=1164594 RepID=A0A1I1GWT2_9BURK|nr:TonB-dependent siderophore receptor [Massilia yuzhufengensis]SFC13633.1 iron complex outermembrane recepter protein [Massilia yuzhufengensis]
MTFNLKYSVLACAVLQAFAPLAQAQQLDGVASVVVTGSRWVASDRASIGGFTDAPLLDTPASITAISSTQMLDLSIRNVTDAARFDASVGDAYNAVGYAEQFSIRGFALDNASSYRKDGIAISADTQIPLENKERIEVLRGLAGLQAGVAAPGGMVNFVTKRPTSTSLRSALVEVSERGTLHGAIDLGGRFEDRRFGYRINAAADKLQSYVRGADGERQFVSGAFDWQITPDALLQLDLDHQHRSQITAPGYQLLRNEVLPTGVSPKTLLNDQPWTRPVDTDSSNVGLRFEYRLNPDWTLTANANKHWFKRDDYTAFPYGCSNEGDGFYPGYCSNGDYDVYDYQSVGERKTPWGAQAMLQGRFATGAVRHALTVGASVSERHDSYGEYVYDYAGYSNIWNNQAVAPAPGTPSTGPVMERRNDVERALFVQDVATLTERLTLHTGLRYVKLKRDELEDIEQGWVHSKDSFVLPSVAMVYKPARDWSVYGSLSHGLQHGGIAEMGTANEDAVLPPSRSKQVEVGLKGIVNNAVMVSAAAFDIRQGLEYVNAANSFVRAGQQRHRGVEVAAQGKLDAGLNYSLSLMALDAKQTGTGDAGVEGKRVTNVPELRSTAWVEYAVAALPGLKVDALWQYAGSKAFDPANRAIVPGYHVAALGGSYALRVGGVSTILRARVDNVFDKFYWRDVTQSLGGYLLPGAPRTFRVSAQFDF